MSRITEKNRESWDAYAPRYGAREQREDNLQAVRNDPTWAFHPATWALIQRALPDLNGKRICVPSSGDNLAVFAFALMGAKVTSCDLSQNQLDNARRVADRLGIVGIEFLRADTMELAGVERGAYDFVYTSNGVHVWIEDLNAMYRSIASLLKPGGFYVLHEIHPFCRPFGGTDAMELKVVKPYDVTGPFESESEVMFGWRIQDIVNAMLDAGLALRRFEELQATVNYDDPDWIPNEKKVDERGHSLTKDEIDRLYDWRINPNAALPQRMTALAEKQ